MAGVVDEAEDAYSSGTPGLILPVHFSGGLRVNLSSFHDFVTVVAFGFALRFC